MKQFPVDFTRWQWAGLVERDYWAPQFRAASQAFQEIERLSVVEGLRPAAWQYVPAEQLVAATEWAQKHGLLCVPTGIANPAVAYSATARPYDSSKPVQIRVLYIRSKHYNDVFPFTDDEKIGKMLGFPTCCREAFRETWGAGLVDSTFEQVRSTRNLSHTFLRWMGIRLVPHMPCSTECKESEVLAQRFFVLGMEHGYRDEMQLIRDVLDWPIEASRLFGILQLETPALKIVTRTNWTAETERFSYPGVYHAPKKHWWTDNGFASYTAMQASHSLLLNVLREKVPFGAGVMDLGCGNGMLLKRLGELRRDVRIAGLEQSAPIVSRALIPHHVRRGTIQTANWAEQDPSVVIITPGRLLEMNADDAAQTLAKLRYVPMVVLYAYADWNASTSFMELCARAGFPNVDQIVSMPEVSVGLVTK